MRRSEFAAIIAGLTLVATAGCDKRVSTDPAPSLSAAEVIRGHLEAGAGGAVTGGGPTVVVAAPKGHATLTGSFVIKGAPPANPVVKISRDMATCNPDGVTVYNQQLVVNPPKDGGGIANVLIYADAVPDEWTHENAKPGKTDVADFDQKNCVFKTRLFAIQTTQPMRILNSDPVGHNTNLSPEINPNFDQTISPGSPLTYNAEEEERQPFPVKCAIHPWMQAWMITRNNSYFAVSGPDGTFTIPDLPSGVELNFRVWQEKSKFINGQVAFNGSPESLSKGRFKFTLDPAQPNKLDVVVDAKLFK